jgi:hypothetical protein
MISVRVESSYVPAWGIWESCSVRMWCSRLSDEALLEVAAILRRRGGQGRWLKGARRSLFQEECYELRSIHGRYVLKWRGRGAFGGRRRGSETLFKLRDKGTVKTLYGVVCRALVQRFGPGALMALERDEQSAGRRTVGE